jgi:hypothetical protein
MDVLVQFDKDTEPIRVPTDAVQVYQGYKPGQFVIEGEDAWVKYMLDQADDSVLGFVVL